MEKTYDFYGCATKSNVLCSDGLTIAKDAFKHCDGMKVPLVWNHRHNDPSNVLGNAILENKNGDIYAYCSFNDTVDGQKVKKLVQHGDITSLSICANELKKQSNKLIHGTIREVSLVIAPANPGAMIDQVIYHADGSTAIDEDSAIIYNGEAPMLYHSDETKNASEDHEETVQDVIDTMTAKQQVVLYALLEDAIAEGNKIEDDSSEEEENENEEDEPTMKHNVFDKGTAENVQDVLMHSIDQGKILEMAKSKNCGSLQVALDSYMSTNEELLKHGFEPDAIEALFPEYHDVKSGAPELLTDDNRWVGKVMQKVSKSPFSRIRTRQADARNNELERELRAAGYKKGTLKPNIGNVKLVSRTTDPQTVTVKDFMNRDDKIDITDFDVVAYIRNIMRMTLNEELATAILIGDNRSDGDPYKIDTDKIRPIWGDDPLYTIYADVDFEAMKTQLQGTDTGTYFGDNFVYAEATVEAALYAREQYRGSGSMDYYCDPHQLNQMLLARDRNGHRLYKDINDLKSALNVNEIITVEKFANKTRQVDGHTKKLLGIFVNLSDYQLGATKGGEVTSFSDFDINFNQEVYLMETRVSGANTRVKSAIVLEENIS